ncbi:uncharacterized protein RCH25_015620 [Pelodytes ibericus]
MKHWWLLLAVALDMAPMSVAEDVVCYTTGNCYMVLTKKLTFKDANAACGPRGSLTTMKDELEYMEVEQLVSMLQHEPEMGTFWVGLYKEKKECVDSGKILYGYSWVSGGEDSKVSYWAETPKPSCIKKRCVGLQQWIPPLHGALGNHTWAWKESKCNNNFSAICRSHFPWNVSALEVSETGGLTPAFTDDNAPYFFPETSKITIACGGFEGSVTLACTVENGSSTCISTHCSCFKVTGQSEGSERLCPANERASCLRHCLNPSNFSCSCCDDHSPCDQDSSTSQEPNWMEVLTTSSAPPAEGNTEEGWFDTLLIPLILGLVAFGILAMLLWGGIQMCVRKKKPPRKKSIAPVEPEGSDTDSTDHSSSEEDEPHERIELP